MVYLTTPSVASNGKIHGPLKTPVTVNVKVMLRLTISEKVRLSVKALLGNMMTDDSLRIEF